MLTAPLTSPPMAQPPPDGSRKAQFSLTLTKENMETLRKLAAQRDIQPSLSRMVDLAVSEFISRHAQPADEKPRKTSRG